MVRLLAQLQENCSCHTTPLMQWSPVQQLCFMKKMFFQSVTQYAKKTEKSKYVYSQQEWNL